MKASGIGGQALMEGVMMKNGSKYACAVRKPDGEIEIDIQETKSLGDTCKVFKWPIIRGVVTFIESLVIGVKTLMYSASFFDEEEDASENKKGKSEKKQNSTASETDGDKSVKTVTREKKEKTAAEKGKETALYVGLVVLSTVFAIGLFMVVPFFISRFLKKVIESETVLALLEGLIRIALFVGYVAAISCMKDIQRVFMYHGAEHKSINCIEHGLELTVENVRGQSREHKRCGTSFLLIVMVISVIFFVFIRVDKTWLMVLIRLLLIPVIAGISYEFIRVAGRSENKVIYVLSKPGLLLQKCTTREPDDSMIECAIASVEAVFDWRKYQEEARAEEEGKHEELKAKAEEKRKERLEASRQRMAAKGIESEEDEEINWKANSADFEKIVDEYTSMMDTPDDGDLSDAMDEYMDGARERHGKASENERSENTKAEATGKNAKGKGNGEKAAAVQSGNDKKVTADKASGKANKGKSSNASAGNSGKNGSERNGQSGNGAGKKNPVKSGNGKKKK